MSYLQECIQRLSLTPNDTNRYLRLIRQLDKRIQVIQPGLQQKQKQFLEKVRQAREKKHQVESPEMLRDYADIVQKEKLIIGYSREKTHVANQLYQQIQEHSERLKTELNQKSLVKIEDDKALPKKNKPPKFETKAVQKDQWYYDSTEPKYCYCGKASFGEMVACENTFCEKEWFHVECIGETSLPEKWYCAECKKLKDKTRNHVQKSYL